MRLGVDEMIGIQALGSFLRPLYLGDVLCPWGLLLISPPREFHPRRLLLLLVYVSRRPVVKFEAIGSTRYLEYNLRNFDFID
jgi:hypothetical protein